MADSTESSMKQPAAAAFRHVPSRDDCWTEEATSTLVDAWGARYLELNRGNLRSKDWQDVADAVNARHGHTKRTRRTDVQCKNRIDTLKKKFKTEKAKIAESNGTVTSSWPFFSRIDVLIGPNLNKQQARVMPVATPVVSNETALSLPSPPLAVPLSSYRKPPSSSIFTPVILPQKRPLPVVTVDESNFRKNYSAMAAAAAAAAGEDEVDAEEGESDGEEMERIEEKGGKEEEGGDEGMRRLSKAIERFGEIYERVEGMKQKQMVELEKQRMQFAKDLEVQRMQLFMDTQVQLEKIKQAKRSGSSDDIYG
ncbi:sequence-specific DNA binding transcription factor [Abeliophyllum distichum]|uniref:Sequence-specific DNA binding transcription factor n=1 Tax=Abeliophyllum distichum TaxID=126358 RepID=A0ABD1PTT7_9LAMI